MTGAMLASNPGLVNQRKDNMLAVLGKHIDALYLSVSFDFPDHLRKLLGVLKESAKESADDMAEVTDYIPGVPGGAWYIRPYGNGKYQYVLENAAFWIAFSTWANMPALQLQFKAVTLYEYESEVYGEMVDRLVRFFVGAEVSYKAKVSRCDLAVDFQDDYFELPDMRDVVTRARKRTVHYEGGHLTRSLWASVTKRFRRRSMRSRRSWRTRIRRGCMRFGRPLESFARD
jgi:hypothetical protein